MILNNCEIWFAKLDPKRPNRKFSKKNPTWELQIRTSDKSVVKTWEEADLNPKAIIPDEGTPFWRVNLKKRILKANGDNAEPVEVVNGKKEDVDPNTIGNGSIGNIRLFQYEYKNPDNSGIASILMAVQLTRHIVYTPKLGEDFEDTTTETIEPPPESDEEEDDADTQQTTPSPSPSVSVGKKDDEGGEF